MGLLTEGPHPATVEQCTLKVQSATVPAVYASPTDTPLGGLVLIPDIFGLRPLFDDICRRLATHGLAVCSVDPFSRLEAETGPLDVEARRARAGELNDDLILEDLAEAADHVAATAAVPKVSVMGFCLGGMYTLKAAATGRFDRAVSFYGMVRTPAHWVGPGQHDALDTALSACPTLAIFGEVDNFVPLPDVDELRGTWAGLPDHKVVVYRQADHGFVHDPDRPAHRPDDAADAWRRALAFLLG